MIDHETGSSSAIITRMRRRWRTVSDALQPRDHAVAGRAVSTLAIVAASVTAAFSWTGMVGNFDPALLAVTLCACALIVVGGLMMRRLGRRHLVWCVLPFLSVAVIAAFDFATNDFSVAAQVFLFFPTLYAASQLKPAGAIATTAFVVVADAAIVFPQERIELAVTDLGYMTAALVTTATLLILGGVRQARLVALLEQQAAVDPLTGLATRRVLDQAARSALSGAIRGEGTALILVDVDDFKTINDRYGHPGGDAVLVQLAQLFVRSCRAGDIVSRIGGDEIALLLPGCSIDDAAQRAERLLREVREFTPTSDLGEKITVSVTAGFAHSPTQAQDLRSLYAIADEALYHAKRAGKGRVGSPVSTLDMS